MKARDDGRALLEKMAEKGDVRARALLAEQDRIESIDRPIGGAKKPRAKPRQIEYEHQKRLAKYANDLGFWSHHSPNESSLPWEGFRGFHAGVSSGFPDFLIAQPFVLGGERFGGLMIELKAPHPGVPRHPWQGASDTQKAWLTHWRDTMGWRVSVCHGFEAARALIDECYPGGGNPRKPKPEPKKKTPKKKGRKSRPTNPRRRR